MDFVERLLGVAPDSGSGAYEWLLALGLATMATIVIGRRRASGARINPR